MANDYEHLTDAYRIIARLAHEAWANPQEVPLPIARLLLHARDYIGRQLSAKVLNDEDDSGAPKVLAGFRRASISGA